MNTDAQTAPLTVRELMAILAECDPDAPVDLTLPTWFADSDHAMLTDPDACSFGCGYTPQISPLLSGPDIFDENNRVKADVMPNVVEIALSEADHDALIAARKAAIQRDAEGDGMEPEPTHADADSVVVDVRLPREVHAGIRSLLRSVNASHQVKTEGACTHGLLTVAAALEMLAQDLGMVETRPGSWEGSTMAQVLASHGYVA